MTIQEDRLAFYAGALGHSGTLQDLENEWLKSQVNPDEVASPDMWRAYLAAQGLPTTLSDGMALLPYPLTTGQGGGVSVNYIKDIVSATYQGIYFTHKVKGSYSGPVLRVCATNAAASPASTIDVFAGVDGKTPDLTAAIAAYGTELDIFRWYDQSGLGNHADATTAVRNRIVTTEAGLIGAITHDIGGAPYLVPNTVTADRQGVTIIQISEDRGTQVSGMVSASIGNTGATQPYIWLGAATGIQGSGTSVRNYRRAPFADRPYFKALRGDATGSKFWRNDDAGPPQVTGTFGTAQAIVGGSISSSRNGNAVQAAQYTSKSVIYGTIFINGAASDNDIEVNIRAPLYDIFQINRTYSKMVCFIGDSIGWGQGATYARNYPYYMKFNLTSSTMLTNPSTAARLLSAMYASRTDYGALVETGKTMYFVIQGGTNDFGTTTVDANTLYTGTFLPFVAYLKGLTGSPRVAVLTIPARQDTAWVADPQKEVERLAYNQLLRDGAAANGYTCVDRAANPDTQDPNNASFFVNDKLHHLSALYQSEANYEYANGLSAFFNS